MLGTNLHERPDSMPFVLSNGFEVKQSLENAGYGAVIVEAIDTVIDRLILLGALEALAR
jgi:hypothetical protein